MSTDINKKTVDYLANLAKIKIEDVEISRIVSDLRTIVSYISQISYIDTKDIKPARHILPLYNISRKDQVRQSLSVEDVLKNAPEKTDNFFKVPKII
ncbi:MAG TPA: Asp-tRNA(Asn)/Glu-tRNA(Gln) amidotransferase subunit GatC [bacterium]|nr:Asp-tRNA(Asn)/Glu-tRNA(Gln) amidotransferase subunit GatC [bacterium]